MAGFTELEMHIMAHNIVDEYEKTTGKKLSYKEYNEQMKKWEKQAFCRTDGDKLRRSAKDKQQNAQKTEREEPM